MRTTKADTQKALEQFAKVMGKQITQYDHTPEDIGSWYLDYNPTYGGARINEVCNEGYGVDLPFGDRQPLATFVNCINFAIRAVNMR